MAERDNDNTVQAGPARPPGDIPTIRKRLDKLHAILSEALEIEGVIGEEPGEEATAKAIAGGSGLIYDIESGLDRAIEKASAVTRGLGRIADRL